MSNINITPEIYPGVLEYKVIPKSTESGLGLVNGYFNGHTVIVLESPNTLIESDSRAEGYIIDAQKHLLTLFAGYSLVPA
jgi:hypothetical protein